MRTGYTGHITPAEWRWVTLLGSVLVLAAILPFLWMVVSGAGLSQQFMGALHQPTNAASSLARIVQGEHGEWLARYLYTPEPHNGVLIDSIYVLLGHLARITSIPVIVIFHAARIGAAIFMYAAIYYLASVIWMKVRTRRIFFVLAVMGSGLGWLLAPLMNQPDFIDLTYALPYPFFSTLWNVDLPLATAILALLAGAMIQALRPGMNSAPSIANAGPALFVCSLLLALIYPQALLPPAIAYLGLLLARSLRRRQPVPYLTRWILWFTVPALPLIAYYATVFLYNPVVAQVWLLENYAPVSSIPVLVLSVGLPLLIALPGIIRAVRQFEPDGNQFMLLWLFAMLLLIYLTLVIHMTFSLGLMLPIAYFGARSVEDFWFERLPRAWRYRVVMAMVPLISVSLLVVLFQPVMSYASGSAGTSSPVLLEREYAQAFRWLESRRPYQNQVVLAAPSVSAWLPAWTGLRVVYGYSRETLDAVSKRQAVEAWYRASDPATCDRLLNGSYSQSLPYQVNYVLYGPRERALGDGACLDQLTLLVNFGQVRVYLNNSPVATTNP